MAHLNPCFFSTFVEHFLENMANGHGIKKFCLLVNTICSQLYRHFMSIELSDQMRDGIFGHFGQHLAVLPYLCVIPDVLEARRTLMLKNCANVKVAAREPTEVPVDLQTELPAGLSTEILINLSDTESPVDIDPSIIALSMS